MQVNWSFKRMITSSALALLVTSSAYAIPRGPCEEAPKTVCCEEPKPGPFAFSYPKDMNLACPSDFYFRADMLAMQPKQDGLEYAVLNQNDSNNLNAGIVQGFSTQQHDWDWGFGFRLGMGFYLNHDAWTVDTQWTWFRISEDVSSAAQHDGNFVPQWLVGDDIIPSRGNAHSSARWQMKMNVFDLTIGKPYHVSRYLVLNPFFGLRGAWIDQDFSARYGGLFTSPSSVNGSQMDAENDWWGVGTRMGVNTEWNLGGGWQLLANMNASMLYGKVDVKQSAPLGSDTYSIRHEFYRDSPNMELQVGAAWGSYFNDMKHYVKVQAMWEFHQWWDQNWMRKLYSGSPSWVNDTVSRGDLSMSGASVRVSFEF